MLEIVILIVRREGTLLIKKFDTQLIHGCFVFYELKKLRVEFPMSSQFFLYFIRVYTSSYNFI